MMPTPSQLEMGEKLPFPLPASSSTQYPLRPPSPGSPSSSPPIVTRLGCWARVSAVKRIATIVTVLVLAAIAFQQVSCRLHLKHICPRPAQIEFILPLEDHFVFDPPSLYAPDTSLDQSETDELEAAWSEHFPSPYEEPESIVVVSTTTEMWPTDGVRDASDEETPSLEESRT